MLKDSLFSGYDEDTLAMEKLSRKERDALPDDVFGLPRDRKYPLDTKERIEDAIGFFHFCKDPKQRKILAKNIAKRIQALDLVDDITFKSTSLIVKYFSDADKSVLNILDPPAKEKKEKVQHLMQDTAEECMESSITSMLTGIELDEILGG